MRGGWPAIDEPGQGVGKPGMGIDFIQFAGLGAPGRRRRRPARRSISSRGVSRRFAPYVAGGAAGIAVEGLAIESAEKPVSHFGSKGIPHGSPRQPPTKPIVFTLIRI
jgi:hypothetical protein